MSETLVCERCNEPFEVLGLIHPTHTQNQGTFGKLCRRCQKEATETDYLDKEKVRKAINKCEIILYEFSDGGGIKGINKADLWSELEL